MQGPVHDDHPLTPPCTPPPHDHNEDTSSLPPTPPPRLARRLARRYHPHPLTPPHYKLEQAAARRHQLLQTSVQACRQTLARIRTRTSKARTEGAERADLARRRMGERQHRAEVNRIKTVRRRSEEAGEMARMMCKKVVLCNEYKYGGLEMEAAAGSEEDECVVLPVMQVMNYRRGRKIKDADAPFVVYRAVLLWYALKISTRIKCEYPWILEWSKPSTALGPDNTLPAYTALADHLNSPTGITHAITNLFKVLGLEDAGQRTARLVLAAYLVNHHPGLLGQPPHLRRLTGSVGSSFCQLLAHPTSLHVVLHFKAALARYEAAADPSCAQFKAAKTLIAAVATNLEILVQNQGRREQEWFGAVNSVLKRDVRVAYNLLLKSYIGRDEAKAKALVWTTVKDSVWAKHLTHLRDETIVQADLTSSNTEAAAVLTSPYIVPPSGPATDFSLHTHIYPFLDLVFPGSFRSAPFIHRGTSIALHMTMLRECAFELQINSSYKLKSWKGTVWAGCAGALKQAVHRAAAIAAADRAEDEAQRDVVKKFEVLLAGLGCSITQPSDHGNAQDPRSAEDLVNLVLGRLQRFNPAGCHAFTQYHNQTHISPISPASICTLANLVCDTLVLAWSKCLSLQTGELARLSQDRAEMGAWLEMLRNGQIGMYRLWRWRCLSLSRYSLDDNVDCVWARKSFIAEMLATPTQGPKSHLRLLPPLFESARYSLNQLRNGITAYATVYALLVVSKQVLGPVFAKLDLQSYTTSLLKTVQSCLDQNQNQSDGHKDTERPITAKVCNAMVQQWHSNPHVFSVLKSGTLLYPSYTSYLEDEPNEHDSETETEDETFGFERARFVDLVYSIIQSSHGYKRTQAYQAGLDSLLQFIPAPLLHTTNCILNTNETAAEFKYLNPLGTKTASTFIQIWRAVSSSFSPLFSILEPAQGQRSEQPARHAIIQDQERLRSLLEEILGEGSDWSEQVVYGEDMDGIEEYYG